jgi:hypothetical protein
MNRLEELQGWADAIRRDSGLNVQVKPYYQDYQAVLKRPEGGLKILKNSSYADLHAYLEGFLRAIHLTGGE